MARINTIFKRSSINIISLKKMDGYVNFCIENDTKEKIKYKTSYHHILPKSLFPEYSNLKDYPWNGVHLKHSDHYYAHFLLTEAIDDHSQIYAFCAMHNMDKKIGKISKKDLIPAEDFQKKMEERNRHSAILNKKLHQEGRLFGGYKWDRKEASIKGAKTRKYNNTMNPSKYEKRVKNFVNLMRSVEVRRKAYNTLTKEFIASNSNTTTILKEAGKKLSKKLKDNPSILKKRIESYSLTRAKKAKKFNIMSNNKILLENILYKDIRKLSQKLAGSTLEKPMGYNKNSIDILRSSDKEYLIGLYVQEVISENYNEYNLENELISIRGNLNVERWNLYKYNKLIKKNQKYSDIKYIHQNIYKFNKENYLWLKKESSSQLKNKDLIGYWCEKVNVKIGDVYGKN